jgi:hypothetical protein
MLLGGCSSGVTLSGDADQDDGAADVAEVAPDGAPDAAPDMDGVADDAATDIAAEDGIADATDGGEVSCEPQAVWDSRCDWCDPDSSDLLGVFWDGRDCFELWGCSECVGDDCADAFASQEECVAAHAGCPSRLCRDSGGTWYAAGADPCLFTCGLPNPVPGVCDPSWGPCDCGPGRSYVPDVGCRDDTCGDDVLCSLSGGSWHADLSGTEWFDCGVALPCDAADCYPPCDCGPVRNFQSGRGCLPEPGCRDADALAICTATGGTVPDCPDGGPCPCAYDCGVPQSVCIEPGCDCGPFRRFEETVGCVYDARCIVRGEGEPCTGGPHSGNCRDGLVCCNGCGIPLGCPSCRAPCCADDPGCIDGCPADIP